MKHTSTVKGAGSHPMTTSLENEIIGKLCKYIDGVITVKQFSDWFVPIAWDASKNDYRANQLIYSIKMCFAEYDKDTWTAAQLRERLIDLIL